MESQSPLVTLVPGEGLSNALMILIYVLQKHHHQNSEAYTHSEDSQTWDYYHSGPVSGQ